MSVSVPDLWKQKGGHFLFLRFRRVIAVAPPIAKPIIEPIEEPRVWLEKMVAMIAMPAPRDPPMIILPTIVLFVLSSILIYYHAYLHRHCNE